MPEALKLKALSPLSFGDYMPPLVFKDDTGKDREINLFAGKPTFFCILPPQFEEYNTEFINRFKDKLGDFKTHGTPIYFIVPGEDPKDFRAKFNVPQGVMSDPDFSFCEALGIKDKIHTSPYSLLLEPTQRIIKTIDERNAVNHLGDMLRASKQIHRELLSYKLQLPAYAPITVIPNALNADECAEIINYWEEGSQYAGTIGQGQNAKVDNSGKRRIDVDVRDVDLLAKIDATLNNRVFTELQKVFALDVTCRDRYKIGCYDSEDKGYYNQHRDTSIASLSHRRISVSIVLNRGFEGGFLEFPEYGPHARFQIDAGTALCFPSPLLHKVTPVTKGKRFIMVSFFHGELEENWRKEQLENNNQPYTPGDVRLRCEKRYPNLQYSDNFYTRSTQS